MPEKKWSEDITSDTDQPILLRSCDGKTLRREALQRWTTTSEEVHL